LAKSGLTVTDLGMADHLSNGEWVLKNSLAEIAPKNRRAGMPYKRFSPTWYTFLVIFSKSIFGKQEFFNSHAI
jgi:hypothetical protein